VDDVDDHGQQVEMVTQAVSGLHRHISSRGKSAIDYHGDATGACKVPLWGRLVPVFPHIYCELFLDHAKFLVGRHVSCHARITLPEVSSHHVILWKVRVHLFALGTSIFCFIYELSIM
jgi:hypothetical protein